MLRKNEAAEDEDWLAIDMDELDDDETTRAAGCCGGFRDFLALIFVTHTFKVQVALVILTILDMIIEGLFFFTEIVEKDHKEQKDSDRLPFFIVSMVVALIFFLAPLLTLFAVGPRGFFYNQRLQRPNYLNTFELIVMFLVLMVVTIGLLLDSIYFYLGAIVPATITRFVLLLLRSSVVAAKTARRVVAFRRNRYTKNGFDLDLSYITDRVIAMGYPSSQGEAIVRNDIHQVAKFFNRFHPEQVRVYNMCAERTYDATEFHNRMFRVPFDDHNPGDLFLLLKACEHIDEWMSRDSSNILAVHCKAGKGRTGTMIASWLVYQGMTAEQALGKFAEKRTQPGESKLQGVQTPSQARYVHYFEQYLKAHKNGSAPAPQILGAPGGFQEPRLRLTKFMMMGVPKAKKGQDTRMDLGKLYFVIWSGTRNQLVFKSHPHIATPQRRLQNHYSVCDVLGEGAEQPRTDTIEANVVEGWGYDPEWEPEMSPTSSVLRKSKRRSRNPNPRPTDEMELGGEEMAAKPGEVAARMEREKRGEIFRMGEAEVPIVDYNVSEVPPLQGDVHLQFFTAPSAHTEKNVFQFWLHTRFIEPGEVTLGRAEVDKAHKDSKCLQFANDWALRMEFERV